MKLPPLACSATDGGWYLGGMTKSNTIVANIASEKKMTWKFGHTFNTGVWPS